MKALIATLAGAALLVGAGPAVADPGGTSERNNQVSCGSPDFGIPSPLGGYVLTFTGPRGSSGTDNSLVLCSDDNLAPDGRVIVGNGGEGGGQVCLDGDESNDPGVGIATVGWACARGGWGEDADGIRCQWHDDPSTDVDDRNSQRANGSPEECPVALG